MDNDTTALKRAAQAAAKRSAELLRTRSPADAICREAGEQSARAQARYFKALDAETQKGLTR